MVSNPVVHYPVLISPGGDGGFTVPLIDPSEGQAFALPAVYDPAVASAPSAGAQGCVPVPVDTTGDGVANAMGFDTTGDGKVDSVDTTGDGRPDTKLQVRAAMAAWLLLPRTARWEVMCALCSHLAICVPAWLLLCVFLL